MVMQGLQSVGTSDGSGFYVPVAQAEYRSARLLIRAQGAPLDLSDDVRDLVRSIDRDLAVSGASTLSAEISGGSWDTRIIALIYGIFGAAALFLASVGLFGVVSFGVERRTQEVGVRMAIGARARDVVGLIVGQGLKQIGLGLIVGIAMAAGLARVMAGLMFQTGPWDPGVYAMIVGLILLVGCLASLFPAIRAARMDPAQALRSQ